MISAIKHRRARQGVEEQALQFEPPAASAAGFLDIGVGSAARRIAFLRRAASAACDRAGLVWLGGFRSNMRGEKASFLDRAAAAAGRACLRFDYSGHGESGGLFARATIGMWLEESLAAFRALTEGPQILVGSSMGGWLALLAARALAESGESGRLAGLLLIAPAADMTEKLIFEKMSRAARTQLARKGVFMRASPYETEPHPISREFIEEGRSHLLFGGTIRSHCPVHILQGMRDETVPWRCALALVEHMHGDPVTLTLIKDGDHRLSRPQDLARIWAAVEGLGDHRLDKSAGLV